MEFRECNFVKSCCQITSLRQISFLSSLMALFVIATDVLSFIGLLPFSGGYTFSIIACFYFTLGPGMWATIGSWLTPSVLFLLMNVMIVAILLSSGFLAALAKEDMSDLLPVVDIATPQVQDRGPIVSSRRLSRSASTTSVLPKPKVAKKVKRQYSFPSPSSEFPEDDQRSAGSRENRCSSLIIMELPSESTKPPPSEGMNNLVTCDQVVFNEIVGGYIDKFRQDMRQQEVESMLNGHILASSYPQW